MYSDEPLLDPTPGDVRLDDAAVEAARVLYFNTPLESEEMDAARRNRIMGTITGVQGFARCVESAELQPSPALLMASGGDSTLQDAGTCRQSGLARSALVET